MICSKCGETIANNSSFCMHCGAPVKAMPVNHSVDNSKSSDEVSQENHSIPPKTLIICVALVALALVIAAFGISNIINNKKEKKASSSRSNSYSTASYEIDHSTYCLLYMKVSNVKVTHSGNYAYVSGTITNNGSYQIKYVKVKAECKDYRGNVIDTDWTYAVDSTWLDPGESKKFEMMVKDTNKDIKNATVKIVY